MVAVEYITATCTNLYVECLEANSSLHAVKGVHDEDCVWCAKNYSVFDGYAIAYEERERCDGVVVAGACPPDIQKVTRNASTYRIEGENLSSITYSVADEEYPSVLVCGQQCHLTSSKWSSTSLVCSVENDTSSCDVLTFRTIMSETRDVFHAKFYYRHNANKHSPYNTNLLRRYYGRDDVILTMVHYIDDEVLPDSRRELVNVLVETLVSNPFRSKQLILLILSLCGTGVYAAYVKIRQYRRRKEWETTLERLEDMEEIDRGSFGTVFCAKHDGARVAVKLLSCSHLGSYQRQFENEIFLLKTLGMRYRHPHVIRLLWVVLKPQIAIITELCHDSLHRQIHDNKRKFEHATVLDFCNQIASGMFFLHSKGVVHRDLKSGNVLMADKDGTTLKICDFGMSHLKPSRWALSPSDGYFAGSLLWMIMRAHTQ